MILTLEGQPGYSAIENAAYAKGSIEPSFITSPALSTSANGGKGSGFDGQTSNSMPNYLAWASGSTWGVTSDMTASGLGNEFNNTPSLFSQAVSHNVPVLAFAENVTTKNVTTGAASDGYYSRHNAYSYFSHLEPSGVAPAMNSLVTVPAPGGTTARSSQSTTTAGSIPFYESYLTNTPGILSNPKTQPSPYKPGTALLNDPADASAFISYAPNGNDEAHDHNNEDQFLSNFIPAVQSTNWYRNGGIILVFTDNEGGADFTAAEFGQGGARADQPSGGESNFFVIAQGLDSRNFPAAGGTITASYGEQVAANHVLTQPISQIGVSQSVDDYYGWGYNPHSGANTSSGVATHPQGSAKDPLPTGYGTILPLLQLAKTNAGH